VIIRALARLEPFEWGLGVEPRIRSKKHRELFEEAAKFGINYGFTIPIHDSFGPVAAVTFATDVRNAQFQRFIKKHARVLQLMAMYFHAQARLTIDRKRDADLASLSPREAECQMVGRGQVRLGNRMYSWHFAAHRHDVSRERQSQTRRAHDSSSGCSIDSLQIN